MIPSPLDLFSFLSLISQQDCVKFVIATVTDSDTRRRKKVGKDTLRNVHIHVYIQYGTDSSLFVLYILVSSSREI